MNYTREDYEWLRDNVEKHLVTTYHMRYKVATPHSINLTVAEILERTTKQPVNKNFVCGSCLFNVFNRAAQLYFQDKEEYDKQEVSKQLEPTPIEKARAAKKAKAVTNKDTNTK